MEISIPRIIDYGDVDARFKLKLGALFKLLQESAVIHSERVGFDSKTLIDNGAVWIIHMLEAKIYRYPELRESIDVITWHKYSKGFKAYRDFHILAGRQEVAAASSLWLYFDINRKRLIRVPSETGKVYTCEKKAALDSTLDAWKPDNGFTPRFETDISVRHSDFDPLGHVNNAVYFDYLETAIVRRYHSERRATQLRIQYKKEIGMNIKKVKVGLAETETGVRFELSGKDTVFAAGDMGLTPQNPE